MSIKKKINYIKKNTKLPSYVPLPRTSADVSLFVTYTYADGSVERKLLESDYFTSATEENVAMSDYILYMGDGRNAPVKVETIAVPNANADGTINGAKLGAGNGVEKTFDFND